MSQIVDLKNPLVLITGATGAIGPRVTQFLYQAGFRIRAFSIDAPTLGMFPQGVEILIGDVTDKAAVQSAMQDVNAVVQMAALLHIGNPASEVRKKFEHINVRGTATVVEAAIKASVGRVVLFSSIALYGPGKGQILDEESSVHADTFYSQTKLAAEQIVLKAQRSGGKPIGTVLRLAAVYGSRIKGNYRRLVHLLARGRFIPIGNGLNRRTLVYDKDVARATALAVSHPAAAGRVFNVTDCTYYPVRDVIVAICAALGRTPPRISLPVSPIRFAAGLLEDSARAIGLQPPIVCATIDKYTEDIAVSGDKIRKILGFNPEYDLALGWQETVQEMRRNGDL